MVKTSDMMTGERDGGGSEIDREGRELDQQMTQMIADGEERAEGRDGMYGRIGIAEERRQRKRDFPGRAGVRT
jgi:hypothetical protein